MRGCRKDQVSSGKIQKAWDLDIIPTLSGLRVFIPEASQSKDLEIFIGLYYISNIAAVAGTYENNQRPPTLGSFSSAETKSW